MAEMSEAMRKFIGDPQCDWRNFAKKGLKPVWFCMNCQLTSREKVCPFNGHEQPTRSNT